MTNFKISNMKEVTSQGKMSVQPVPRAGFYRMPTGTNKPRNLHHHQTLLCQDACKNINKVPRILNICTGERQLRVQLQAPRRNTSIFETGLSYTYIYIYTYFMFINCRGLRHIRPIISHLKNSSHKWKTQFTIII
jgi:hypothetical protein